MSHKGIIFTIGFTKKSAATFFGLIKANPIRTLIDVRLNNSSQLAGFSKGGDLEYFLGEICGCAYRHETIFAPTKELMDSFKSNRITPEQFASAYRRLMTEREAVLYFDRHYAESRNVCLLCSEDAPERCHRRVLAEMLAGERPGPEIRHL